MARTSSLNCLSCKNPYQTPQCLPPFRWKTFFCTEKCFVASPSQNRLHENSPRSSRWWDFEFMGVKHVVDFRWSIFCHFASGNLGLKFVTENFTTFFTARNKFVTWNSLWEHPLPKKWLLSQRAANGGSDPSWLNLAFLGRPNFSPEVPKIPIFKGFWDLWTENRGAPKTPNSTTTDLTPHLRPSDYQCPLAALAKAYFHGKGRRLTCGPRMGWLKDPNGGDHPMQDHDPLWISLFSHRNKSNSPWPVFGEG